MKKRGSWREGRREGGREGRREEGGREKQCEGRRRYKNKYILIYWYIRHHAVVYIHVGRCFKLRGVSIAINCMLPLMCKLHALKSCDIF